MIVDDLFSDMLSKKSIVSPLFLNKAFAQKKKIFLVKLCSICYNINLPWEPPQFFVFLFLITIIWLILYLDSHTSVPAIRKALDGYIAVNLICMRYFLSSTHLMAVFYKWLSVLPSRNFQFNNTNKYRVTSDVYLWIRSQQRGTEDMDLRRSNEYKGLYLQIKYRFHFCCLINYVVWFGF